MDEVMVAVTSGELSPIIVGTIYCSVVEACFELFDMRRVQGMDRSARPLVRVPARPGCVSRGVSRSARRDQAAARPLAGCGGRGQARLRSTHTADAPRTGGAACHYQLAEVHRLRGEFAKAEAYAARQATRAARHIRHGPAAARAGSW